MDCRDCKYVVTPKGHQCYTLSRILTEKVVDKGLPFSPEIVVPILDSIVDSCKRYKYCRRGGVR